MEIKEILESSNIHIILNIVQSHRKIEELFTQNPDPDIVKWCYYKVEQIKMSIDNRIELYNIKYFSQTVIIYNNKLIS